MADGQISFYHLNSADASSFNKEGAIIISKRDTEKHYADILINIGNQQWQIRPDTWDDEIKQYVKDEINKQVNAAAQTLLSRYLRIEKTEEEDPKNIVLDIFTSSENEIVTQDGEAITAKELNTLIKESTENGTFLVNNSPVKIHGLGTAAYTSTDNYTPMEVSIWTDLESDING